MPFFHYRGRDDRGAPVTGRIESSNEAAVADNLLSRKIIPIDIVPENGKGAAVGTPKALIKKKKVKLDDLVFFCRQMHTLLRAGVPMLEALQSLRQSNQETPLSDVIVTLIQSLNTGTSLSGAMRQRSDVFPALFISIIELGETSGNLPETFLQLAGYLEQDQTTRSQVRAAIRYPMFVLIAIGVAITIINVFVIPTFARVFAKFDADLPLPTKILITTSRFTIDYWYLVVFAVVATVFAFRRYIKTTRGRYVWDKHKLKLPLIGKIIFGATLARFSRALAINMKAGVPWNAAMNILSETVDNSFIAGHVISMRDGVEQGESITRTAAATGLFPPLVLQMMAVGEQAGSVDKLMFEVADYYEREVEYSLKKLSASIEPILTIAMAILVLILALGVFLPMWGLADAAMGKNK